MRAGVMHTTVQRNGGVALGAGPRVSRVPPQRALRPQGGFLTDNLTQLALLAHRYDYAEEAAHLTNVAIALGVDEVRLWLLVALMKHEGGQHTRCAELLEGHVLSRSPDHEFGRALLAAAWRATGDGRWRTLASAVLATCTDPAARQWSIYLLNSQQQS